MSRLSNFVGKPVVIKVQEQEFRVYPIAPSYEPYFRDLYSKDESKAKEALFQLMKASLKDEPDVVKSETDTMMLAEKNAFVDSMLEVNGYNKRISDAQQRIVADESR